MRPSLALLLCLFAISYSYILDSSCAAYTDMVITGLKAAFDLGQAAHDILKTPPKGDRPVEIAQKELIEYLFLDALQPGGSNSNPWATVIATFESVLKFNTNNGNPEASPDPSTYWVRDPNKLIFFCDYKRFNIQTDSSKNRDCSGALNPNITCDSLMKVDIPLNSTTVSHCLNPTTDESYMAWTKFETVTQPAFIQLCPPYLKNVQKSAVKNLGDIKSNSMRAMSKKKPSAKKLAMDLLFLFDSTLLHEMTHAISTPPHTVDIKQKDSYGWRVCVQFSDARIINNADNYPFLGLGARMISPHKGMIAARPLKNGTVELLPANEDKKRDEIGYHEPFRPRDTSITSLINDTTVTVKASDAAGFAVSAPSPSRPVSQDRAYTISTDVVSLESSAVVYDHSTVLLPTLSVLAPKMSSTGFSPDHSVPVHIGAHSTFRTLTPIRRGNDSPSLSSPSITTNTHAVTATPIGDDFNQATSWDDRQQSELSELMADTTEAGVTWSPTQTSAHTTGSSTRSSNGESSSTDC